MGQKCRYDATDNLDTKLLGKLEQTFLIPFCPEEYAFGSPRPTMALVQSRGENRAVSNVTGADLSPPIEAYAKKFFETYPDIDLFIGKDRSPSCGVCSARIYDGDRNLLSSQGAGLMAAYAKSLGIECWDAESYLDSLAKKSSRFFK